jgi:hypothetical protein
MSYLAARRAKAREYKTFRQHMQKVWERMVLMSAILFAVTVLAAANGR